MAKMRELFEKIEDGGKAELEDGSVAIRKGKTLVWDNTCHPVDVYLILHGEWSIPVEEEEKEIETEKWRERDDGQYGKFIGNVLKEEIETEKWYRCISSKSSAILYQFDGACNTPGEVMDRKNFLRWVGTMPCGGEWPGNHWRVWLNKERRGWNSSFDSARGHTEKVYADYALMKKEI